MAAKKVTAQEAYRVLSKVYSQRKMAKVLVKLDTDRKARTEAKKDARTYLINQGIKLPADATAHFTSNKWKLTICFFVFCISFEHS
jgi:hypothetical protein